ncbi:CoA-transferase [Streptomyces gobiensis]|uniref:CoA-transferase n=1 Tax=Streptomyces gobiensis TaxID=2875706 RepID=UPI001E44F943|nr:CoA-transferase [Streptomyces gobiensis]UGY94138.1 acetate CoA-transferase [Streptomyces gobiensis]
MTADRFLSDPDELCRRHLTPGMRVHIASTMSRPGALTLALARVFGGVGRFEISVNALHAGVHALTMAGVIERAVIAFAGDTVPTSRPNRLYAGLPAGDPFPVEEWSLLSLLQRLMAGATGAPAALSTSLIGSSLPQGHPPLETVPSGGAESGAGEAGAGEGTLPAAVLPALRPDVTLLHAHCADRRGNLYLAGPVGEGWWGAMAARRGVLATVERVCDGPPAGAVCSIPAERVLAVAPCPFGAHPQGLTPMPSAGVAGYLDDYAFLADLADACARQEDTERWFQRWVTGTGGHTGYLAQLGEARLAGLTAELRCPQGVAVTAPPAPPSEREHHIVMAARTIARTVVQQGYGSVLAGIGISHLASWLAARTLHGDGVELQVVNELGMVDFTPEAGDSFLFSQRHVLRCREHAGTWEVLGGLVAGGGGRTLGVLSAAQIDQQGRINTSRTARGGFLVGSGGANDVASHLDTVVVAPASPRRYPEAVGFITSPGHHVSRVVAEFGSFERTGGTGPFTLTTWSPYSVPEAAGPAETVRDRTAWKADIADPLLREPPPTDEELAALRSIDPEGIYR